MTLRLPRITITMRNVPVVSLTVTISPIYGVNPAHTDREALPRQIKNLERPTKGSRIRYTRDIVGD